MLSHWIYFSGLFSQRAGAQGAATSAGNISSGPFHFPLGIFCSFLDLLATQMGTSASLRSPVSWDLLFSGPLSDIPSNPSLGQIHSPDLGWKGKVSLGPLPGSHGSLAS